MKKKSVVWGIVVALFAGVTFLLTARTEAQQGARPRPGLHQGLPGLPGGLGGALAGPGRRAGLLGGLMLADLDLSNDQKERIRAIIAANRTALEPYRNQARDGAKALREATANGQFNETQVRGIADALAKASVELLVGAERLKAEIYTVLTPEQINTLKERQTRIQNRIRGLQDLFGR